jgi:hypothetical protein
MSAVLITGKLIFQDSWCRGVEWDEILPEDLGTRWHNWVKLLPHLLDIHIPKWVGTTDKGDCQIHIFCNASERAYGAALYIRSTHGMETTVRIVCNKNRLAPLKRVTLPRLELIAALIGARLLNYFSRKLDKTSRKQLYGPTQLWLWVGFVMTPIGWKTFVGNRVTEIYLHYAHAMETLSRRGKSGSLLITRDYRRAPEEAAKMVARSFVAIARSVSLAAPGSPNAQSVTR